MPTEKSIESLILCFLNSHSHCYAWKNNNTGIFDPVKKTFRKSRGRHIINGVSDIIGVYNGRPLFIEVKTPTTIKSFKSARNSSSINKTVLHAKRQWQFLETVKNLGAIAFVAASVEDCRKELKGFEK